MSCSADYYLVTCSQRQLVCADVCSARTSQRYQNRKFTMPSQFGIVGAANWWRRLVRAEHTSAHTITTVTHSQRRIVGAANFGRTDQAVLHDIITHDKLFQHILVGATSTSAPTSRCFQCLQKNSFAHFLWVICSEETYGRVCQPHMAQQYLVYHRVYRVLQCLFLRLHISEQKIQAPLSNHTHAIFPKVQYSGTFHTKYQSALHDIRSTYYFLLQILFFFALLAEQ